MYIYTYIYIYMFVCICVQISHTYKSEKHSVVLIVWWARPCFCCLPWVPCLCLYHIFISRYIRINMYTYIDTCVNIYIYVNIFSFMIFCTNVFAVYVECLACVYITYTYICVMIYIYIQKDHIHIWEQKYSQLCSLCG